jgi:hypothetical protein
VQTKETPIRRVIEREFLLAMEICTLNLNSYQVLCTPLQNQHWPFSMQVQAIAVAPTFAPSLHHRYVDVEKTP